MGLMLREIFLAVTCDIERISLKCHHLRRERRFSWGTKIIARSRWTAREKCNRGVEISKVDSAARKCGITSQSLPAHLRASEVPSVSVISRNRPRGRIRARAGWLGDAGAR